MVRGAGYREPNPRLRRREKNVLDIPLYRPGLSTSLRRLFASPRLDFERNGGIHQQLRLFEITVKQRELSRPKITKYVNVAGSGTSVMRYSTRKPVGLTHNGPHSLLVTTKSRRFIPCLKPLVIWNAVKCSKSDAHSRIHSIEKNLH
jgi:hypothetical protein